MINYIDVKNIGFKKVQGNQIHHEVWVGWIATNFREYVRLL